MALVDASSDEIVQPAATNTGQQGASPQWVDASNDEIATPSPAAPQQPSSFLGEMGANFRQGVQSGKDLLSGNYEDIGHTRPTPKTSALADKLFPQGSDGSIMDAVRNVGNTHPSDWSSALLEKFADTPEGKAVSAIGGVVPSFNAMGTAVNRYVNPAIASATGIAPSNLQLMELAASPLGLKKAGDVATPEISALKSAAGKIGDTVSNIGSGAAAPPPITPDILFNKASDLYDQADAAGAVVGQPKVQGTAADIKTALDDSNFDADFHPQTAKWLEKFTKAANATDDQGNPIDMPWAKLNGYRKLLNGVINDGMKQGGNEDSYQAMTARDALDNGIGSMQTSDLTAGDPKAIDLTKQANTMWSAGSQADTLQKILDKGENAAVPATSYKNGFNKLANSPAINKYTPAEQEAIRYAAQTGIVTGALKIAGSRIMSGIAGSSAGGIPGFLAAEAASYPFRQAANALQAGRGQSAIEAIGNRPAVQDILNPTPAPSPASAPAALPAPAPSIPAQISGALPAATAALTNQGRNGALPPVPAPAQRPMAPAPQPIAQPAPQANQAPTQDDSGLLHKIAMVESGGNQNARSPNPNSSASGMFGINNQTWRYLVGKYGQQLGVTMGDRMNPQAQAVMTQAYMNENRQQLSKVLGRDPQPHELYLAHFLGANGASKLLTNMQNTQLAAARLLPQAAQENPAMFFQKGVPLNSQQVSQKVQARLGV